MRLGSKVLPSVDFGAVHLGSRDALVDIPTPIEPVDVYLVFGYVYA